MATELSGGWNVTSRREHDVEQAMRTRPVADMPERSLPPVRNILSQEEIEALLRPNLPDEIDGAPESVSDVSIPDLDAAAAAPTVGELLVTICQGIAARLSLAFRQGCGLRAVAELAACRRTSFREGLSRNPLGRGTAIACYTAAEGEISAMLLLGPQLAAAMIDAACGGKPGHVEGRELTVLDLALLEGLVRPLGQAVSSDVGFARIESDAEFASALARPDEAVCIDLNVRYEQAIYPARLVLYEGLVPETPRAGQPPAAVADYPAFAAGSATAVLTARVASLSVPLSRLADLKPGSTLLLGVPEDQPVQLLSGGRDGPLIAEGNLGRKGSRMALRLTRRTPVMRAKS